MGKVLKQITSINLINYPMNYQADQAKTNHIILFFVEEKMRLRYSLTASIDGK